MALLDWNSIPGNQREKLTRAKEVITKRLERDYEKRLQAEAAAYRKQTDEALAAYKAKLKAEAEVERQERNEERERYKTGLAAIRAKGLITEEQYKNLVFVAHPDNSASEERRAEAFRLLRDPRIKALLVKGAEAAGR